MVSPTNKRSLIWRSHTKAWQPLLQVHVTSVKIPRPTIWPTSTAPRMHCMLFKARLATVRLLKCILSHHSRSMVMSCSVARRTTSNLDLTQLQRSPQCLVSLVRTTLTSNARHSVMACNIVSFFCSQKFQHYSPFNSFFASCDHLLRYHQNLFYPNILNCLTYSSNRIHSFMFANILHLYSAHSTSFAHLIPCFPDP